MTTKTTCPYCHQTTPDKALLLTPSHGSREDDIAHIQAETRRVDDLIAQLHEDRAALLCRLNAVQSTTRTLLPEILSLIFQHASPAPDYFLETSDTWDSDKQDPSFHLVAGSVSSLWRQVVHSTPDLWNSIRIETLLKNAGKWTVFLQTSFVKSGSLPMDIAFTGLGKEWLDHDYLFSPEVDEALLNNAHRIRSLRLHLGVPQLWSSMIPRLTGLSDLSIESRTPFPHLSFSSNLRLNRLLLDITTQTQALDLAGSLTVLSLSGVAIDLCLHSFVNLPELVEFRCSLPKGPVHDHATLALSSPVVLQKLEYLQWTFLPDAFLPYSHDLLTYVEVPSLKTLRWVEMSELPHLHEPSSFAAFLRERLPLTLKNLEFVEIDHQSFFHCNLIELIRKETQIESIVLERCSESFLCAVLRQLQRENEGPVPFPFLDYIHVEICLTSTNVISDSLSPETGAYLATALRQRCDEIDHFMFSVDLVTILDWEQETIDDLQSLIFDEEVILRVLHNGESILLPDESDMETFSDSDTSDDTGTASEMDTFDT